MLIETNPCFSLHRHGRFLLAEFHQAHQVLSTCRVNGGLRHDLTHLLNHQSCEGVAHSQRHEVIMGLGLHAYHATACAEAHTPAATTALMSTAANMQCAVISRAAYTDLLVQVVATAGVLGNATRAGDPASWHEQAEGSVRVSRCHTATAPSASGAGTIVTLVFINQACTPACLVTAAAMVTEGKTTALWDLRIPSLQSAGLATGTGTDQLAIASPIADTEGWARHWAGSHNTLGELLAQATHDAVTRCLLLQNGLCAELRRTVCAALGRHGCHEAALRACAAAELDTEQAKLFTDNLIALIHDPQSAAAAYGLAESIDLARTGILHREAAHEAILNHAALLGATVAVQPEAFTPLRTALSQRHTATAGELAALAMVWGFARKWSVRIVP